MSGSASLSETVLAGDIGGTHARLALAQAQADGIALVHQRIVPVHAFATVQEALADFLNDAPMPKHACLAWAGPIEGTRARLTNGAWAIDTRTLADAFGATSIALVNDFYAAAVAVDQLAPEDCTTLQAGTRDADGARLVIGAGTGLGVAYALPDAQRRRILAGEGGHVGFAPQDDEQVALLAHCRAELGRVTAEHLVSGSGIVRIYAFCCAQAGTELPADVAREGAAAVTQRAEAGEAEAKRALRLFCAIYGAVAGDHALSCLATGGVFVAGGIAARLAARLADGAFVAAFTAKGVHSALVARMPVHLVLDELVGLKGAAAIALRQANARSGGGRRSV